MKSITNYQLCDAEKYQLMLQAKSMCLQHEIECQQIQILRDVIAQRKITWLELFIQFSLSCLFAPAMVKFLTTSTIGIIGDASEATSGWLDTGLNWMIRTYDDVMGQDQRVLETKLFSYFGDYVQDKIFWQEVWTAIIAFVLCFLVIHVVFAFSVRLRYDNLHASQMVRK